MPQEHRQKLCPFINNTCAGEQCVFDEDIDCGLRLMMQDLVGIKRDTQEIAESTATRN